MQWNDTANRTLKWIGIGSADECTININNFNAAGNSYVRNPLSLSRVANRFPNRDLQGWLVGAAADNCTVSATASYIWPQAFYNTTCAPQFQITQEPDNNTQTLTFLIFVQVRSPPPGHSDVSHFAQYEDCVTLERNGVSFVQCQNTTTELPVQIIFPTFTQVSTLLPIGVFSMSSINSTVL